MKYTEFKGQYYGYDNDQADLFNLRVSQGHVEVSEAELPKIEEIVLPEKDYKHFTGQDKLDLFTEAEQRAIYTAAYADVDVDVIMVVKGLDNALYLTYSDPRTVAGLELLEDKGLITPERHQEIIDVMTSEREV